MNSLISRLREAKTLVDADPILKQLGASGAIKKLVEASILQRMSPNAASYEYGVTMLNEAIKELDVDEEPASPESPGLKTKGDKFVQEEELANHNPGNHGAGSEQSTENTSPYPLEAKKEGDEDMTNAPDVENQMSETGGEAPFPKNLSEEMNGLHPDIAKSIGQKMPKVEPLDLGTQMKQTRYTLQKYHEIVMIPLQAHSKKQDAAIKQLSQKIRETEARAGTFSMNIDGMKQNAPAAVRETTQTQPATIQELITSSRNQNKHYDLNKARLEIILANNQMSN